jgi:hypothetical protein
MRINNLAGFKTVPEPFKSYSKEYMVLFVMLFVE